MLRNVARRVLSSMADIPAPTSLSSGQALASARIVLDFLKYGVPGTRLERLHEETAPIEEKWTKALQILVASQAHCAAAFGYEGSSDGVLKYRTHLAQSTHTAGAEVVEQLKALDADVWSEILLRGFALAPRPMEPDDARAFASRVAAEVSRLDALTPDQATEFAALATTQDGQVEALNKIQRMVFDIQRSLAPEFGYKGDDGYVQLQAALVGHMADPVVMHSTQAAMHAICQRAGVKPPF